MTRHFLCLRPAVCVLVLACALAGCARGPTPIHQAEREVAAYIDGGGYMRDFSAVVKQARAYLDRRARGDTSTLAVVLDVDETALSNWPAYRVNDYARVLHGECNLQTGPCGIFAYQETGRMPALPPTLELARAAKALGMMVIFISGRPSELQAVTERNLREAGYPYDTVIVRPPGTDKTLPAADFKSAQRAGIERQGLKIILCMGDQQSDLDGGHCERTFKLPNPVYFLP